MTRDLEVIDRESVSDMWGCCREAAPRTATGTGLATSTNLSALKRPLKRPKQHATIRRGSRYAYVERPYEPPNGLFSAYVDDLHNGREWSVEGIHAWPQTLKLDVLQPPRRFDFIGTVENMNADLSARAAWAAAPLAANSPSV